MPAARSTSRSAARPSSSRAATGSPFGRTTLVTGPEGLLADRAVADLLARARKESPEVEVSRTEAAVLDGARLTELSGSSLFATRKAVVVTDLGNLAPDVAPELLEVVAARLVDVALVLVHPGGQKGKGVLDKLKALDVTVVDCPPVKTWELPQFVAAEIRQAGGTVDPGAAQALVDAVGADLRALAAGAAQLVSDTEGHVRTEDVRRYFGGRADVTSFAVTDSVLAGSTGVAMEQLRWALTTGVPPVLVTSALASGIRALGKLVGAAPGQRDVDLAREVGVPPWKLKSMRAQARGWDARGLAVALRAVATADADVKGAAEDAAFSLERAVLAVAAARRS
ncbi:DNA polymerase III subunit delta [Microlunatus flavus]|uniref:DNA-directed DNA polymerase n=1 Tax=Microlunatus flavus TaxID=1036181 RepID=A0A1H9DCF2_9ACTN|nr:DNA polymerase III subunit delta [Microlunatus flavus]SEQ11175.1 DNA polymerase III, delta subunit [Microlunatus flavus]